MGGMEQPSLPPGKPVTELERLTDRLVNLFPRQSESYLLEPFKVPRMPVTGGSSSQAV